MWMVEENGNAKTEVERLESEIESLTDHQPDILADVGVDVEYHGIFCCVDGTMSCKEEPFFSKYVLHLHVSPRLYNISAWNILARVISARNNLARVV